MRKLRGLGKKKKSHRHRKQHNDHQREGWVGEAEKGKEGQMVTEGDWTWGGKRTIQYTDDVL